MLICQKLEEFQREEDYIRCWRAVWFRVLRRGTKFVWDRYRNGQGFIIYWNEGDVARRMARKGFHKNIPVMGAVHHGKKVTGREAERLTGILVPYSMDRLQEFSDSDLESPVVLNYVKPKKPPKAPPTAQEQAQVQADRCARKARELTTRIKRLTTCLKKWERRQKIWERKANSP